MTMLPRAHGTNSQLQYLNSKQYLIVKKCLNSRSDVVSYVAKFGVYFGHQNSVFSRNVSFCSEHFF